MEDTEVKTAPCGIITFTNNGVITYANAFCKTALEYDDNLIGLQFFDLLTISGKIFYQTHFYPLLKMQFKADEIFLNLVSAGKKDVPVLLNAVMNRNGIEEIVCSFIPVFNRRKYEDEILHAKKIAEDALQHNEELQKLKEQLEKHQKLLDEKITTLTNQNSELLQLNDVLTHDLQEPTRKLILFSTELQTRWGNEEHRDNALIVIKKSANQIRHLLKSLQEYLTVETDYARHEYISLSEIIDDEINILKAEYPGIEVIVTQNELPLVKADKNLIAWLFYHLIKNAFDHGFVNNRLDLNVQGVIVKQNIFSSTEGRYVYENFAQITVTDNGTGFNNLYSEHIFKIRKKLTSNQEAPGFGLAICRKICNLHHGKITATSEINNGASFTLSLPLNSIQ